MKERGGCEVYIVEDDCELRAGIAMSLAFVIALCLADDYIFKCRACKRTVSE